MSVFEIFWIHEISHHFVCYWCSSETFQQVWKILCTFTWKWISSQLLTLHNVKLYVFFKRLLCCDVLADYWYKACMDTSLLRHSSRLLVVPGFLSKALNCRQRLAWYSPSTLHLSAAACSSLPTVEHVEYGAVSVYSEASALWKCVHRTEKNDFFWGGMKKLNDKCIYARCWSAMLRKALTINHRKCRCCCFPPENPICTCCLLLHLMNSFLFIPVFIDFFLHRIYFVISRTGYTDSYNRGTCYWALLVGRWTLEF